MKKIFLTGDMHGEIINPDKSDRFKKYLKEFDKNSIIIVLGDFGFKPSKIDIDCKLNYITKDLGIKILFVDGNHEFFNEINKLPEIDMFEGKVGVFGNNIFHLKRGEVYNINNQKFMSIGGATSIDSRTLGHDWFLEENLSNKDKDKIIFNLKNNHPDIILSHTCPSFINKRFMNFGKKYYNDSTANFMDSIMNWHIDYKKLKEWHFAHFHEDKDFIFENINFKCHYTNLFLLNQKY